MSDIYNATPQIVLRGIDDRSREPVPRSIPLRPTHFPLVYFWAQRGPSVPRPMLNGDQTIYGSDTFNPLKKWYNHATPYISGFLGKGNAVMAHRVVPKDAAPPAASRFCVELLETELDDYERNSDGSIKMVNGNPVPNGTKLQGYTATFLTLPVPDDDLTGFGNGTVGVGTQEDPTTGKKSEIIPLWDLRESSQGADGNLTNYNVFAPTITSREIQFNPQLLSRLHTYPIAFRMGRRSTLSSSPVQVRTLSGANIVLMTLQNGDADPLTNAPLQMNDVLPASYNRFDSSLGPDVYGYIDSVAVYQSNIDRVVGLLYEAEKKFVEDNPTLLYHYDFNLNGEDEAHVMNFLGGVTYNNYPYHTYRVQAGTTGYRPTQSQWVALTGGSDGTMNNETFAELVGEKIQEYADSYSPTQDDARRVESIFYDSGFPMDTKYKLLDFLAIRKDLALVLSVFQEGDGKLSATDQYARASALRTRASLYPDSVYYGTGVARVQICGRSGKLIGSNYRGRVAGTYEFGMKYAEYMGAGNRVWNSDKMPAGYPNSLVTSLTDVDVSFTPVDQRVLDWDVGLNWIQNYDQNSQFIPAYRSVYEDDTSVLTSFITVLAIVEINKVCQQVHRMFSGVDYLTNAQLAERVDREIANQLKSVFGGRFRLEVETTFTDFDLASNYSWTTVVRIGAAGMKTVMTASVESYRIEDLAP